MTHSHMYLARSDGICEKAATVADVAALPSLRTRARSLMSLH